MSLDPYALCPCGNGQKIKFCCSADIVGELDKVFRSIEGDQRAAALDQLNRLLVARPSNPALLAIKGSILLAMEDVEAAEQTIAKFLVADPKNPTALGQSATISAVRGNTRQAVERLQKALEEANGRINYQVHNALRVVGDVLMAEGNVLGSFGHLMLYAASAQGQSDEPHRALARMRTAPQLPLFLRQEMLIRAAPEGAAWKPRFDEAIQLAGKACWLKSCEQLIALAERVPSEPAIIRNIAVLRGYLGDTSGAVLWWHKYATLEAVPLEERVEAEAVAQIVDTNLPQHLVDLLETTIEVQDTDRVMERLLADKRLASEDREQVMAQMEEGDIPPKAVFTLLDRPLPSSGEGLALADMPQTMGSVFVYGRQTDRAAQVKAVVEKTERGDAARAALLQILGEQAGTKTEEVINQVPADAALLNPPLYPPRDIKREQYVDIAKAALRRGVFETWPQAKNRFLDNHAPAEVAANPQYRIRLLAAILQLEETYAINEDLKFNDLRRQFGLPTLEAIDPETTNIDELPVWRLPRLEIAKLSDQQLVSAYRRSLYYMEQPLVVAFGEAILSRPSAKELVNVGELYVLLIRLHHDLKRALEICLQAQEFVKSQSASPAQFMLLELQIRLNMGDGRGAQRLIEILSTQYRREPGIAQALTQILVQLGVLTPDGRMRGAPPPAAEPAGAAAGAIWTPGEPVAPAAEKKSSLWLPD